ncbi:UDP-N-acetylmuramoyl-L-alanine--D-glutamate ligase [Maricaulis sp. D1M11]|uniref:UDP-N-acetylmuramoyl-L-alanine--D-glutamate ligase n=1 Tax=Maricaulis sp. D1M11 TaxID=3076117 RepID=UPI0039B37AEB
MIRIPGYEGRRVAIFGLGRTGIATARALQASGADVIAWDDGAAGRSAAEQAGLTLVDLRRRDWGDISALILSPGVPLTHPAPHPVVELARAVDIPVIGDTELFAQAIAALPEKKRPQIVGITGTNGKSTTTALVAHILAEAGRRVQVGGNIGTAILSLDPPRPGTVYVIELSSYQLDLTHTLACDVAVCLNLSPDHLDRHGGFEGYAAAKARIFSMQSTTGKAVIGVDDPHCQAMMTGLTRSRARDWVTPIASGRVFSHGVYALSGTLYDAMGGVSQPVMTLEDAPALPGRHNAQNAAAALAVVRHLGLSPQTAVAAMKTFPGLAHRQERVGERDGVVFVNDSKATNGEAAVQALTCYPRIYWLAGGQAKTDGLESTLDHLDGVQQAFLFGEAGPSFATALIGRVEADISATLDEALDKAIAAARADGEGGVVLLSPAAASFDQYSSFEARGDAFRTAVHNRLAAWQGEPA